MITLFSKVLPDGADVVTIRRAARKVAEELGFDRREQVRITAGLAELVRAARHAERPADVTVELVWQRSTVPQRLVVEVKGDGLGSAGTGQGGARAVAALELLERFERVSDTPSGTWRLSRALPARAGVDDTAERLRTKLLDLDMVSVARYRDELERQTEELAAALRELDRKNQELARLNAELADTNRGVMALYAELDERANHLRRADELKTRFFSYVSHEFRTPLNSIAALAGLLLRREDGDLTEEQETQVRLIRDSAAELLELVSDLLDLARVEAGKTDVVVGRFSVATLFGTLRGMIRPLLTTPRVRLEFGPAETIPPLVTDEGKVGQILRNFLSNAVKFTEEGSITVTAERVLAGDRVPGTSEPVVEDSVLFRVTDTGIGIDPKDQEAIFDEFTQVRHGLQRKVRGTGLGLPLCRRLAALLGGRVWVSSELGVGSAFYCLVPRVHHLADERGAGEAAGATPLLIVCDDSERRTSIADAFADTPFEPLCVGTAEVTADLLATAQAAVALVDPAPRRADEDGAAALLRRAEIPVIPAGRSASEPANPRELVAAAYRAAVPEKPRRVLVVDDDRRFLTILSKLLEPLCEQVLCTDDPRAALAAAESGGIDCAVVDLLMPDMNGFELLERLREQPATAALPVLICSSKEPTEAERRRLRRLRAMFVSKKDLGADRLDGGLRAARLAAVPRYREPRLDVPAERSVG